MRRSSTCISLWATALVSAGACAMAAADTAYLEIPGIPGESNAAAYEGTIDLSAWQVVRITPAPSGKKGSPVPGACVSEVSVAKHIDLATAPLASAAAAGTVIDTARIYVTKPSGAGADFEYLELELSGVCVLGGTRGDDGDGHFEQLSLSVGQLHGTYRAQDDTGGIAATNTYAISGCSQD